MNLADLSRIDIKDLKKIDYNKLLQTLRSRNDILINIVLVGFTLIIAINTLSDAGKQIQTIKKQINKLEEKITVINTLDNVKAELDEYLANVPQELGEDELATKLTDWAVARNIKIVSVSPVKKKEEKLHDTYSINLSIETEDFNDFWLFIHDIESSPYALRIDRWQMRPNNQYRQYARNPNEEERPILLSVNTTLASVKIKKDE